MYLESCVTSKLECFLRKKKTFRQKTITLMFDNFLNMPLLQKWFWINAFVRSTIKFNSSKTLTITVKNDTHNNCEKTKAAIQTGGDMRLVQETIIPYSVRKKLTIYFFLKKYGRIPSLNHCWWIKVRYRSMIFN